MICGYAQTRQLRRQPDNLDHVCTVPETQGHDIKLNSFKTSVAYKFRRVLRNLTTANERKSGES